MSGHYPDGTTQADIDRHLDGDERCCLDCGLPIEDCRCDSWDDEYDGLEES